MNDFLPKKNHAFIVGIGKRNENEAYMETTATDAKYISESLCTVCRYPKEQVVLIDSANATSSYILEKLQTFAENLKGVQANTVIIYFSGHGEKVGNELYLICKNSAKKEETKIDGKDFVKLLNQIESDKLLVLLDCCYAGTLKSTVLPINLEQFDNRANNRVVLSSSQRTEVSFGGDPTSVFTYFLIKGLTGDFLRPNETSVNLFDLALYLREWVSSRTRGDQKPTMHVIHHSLTTNFTIASFGKSKPTLPDYITNDLRIYKRVKGKLVSEKVDHNLQVEPDLDYRDWIDELRVNLLKANKVETNIIEVAGDIHIKGEIIGAEEIIFGVRSYNDREKLLGEFHDLERYYSRDHFLLNHPEFKITTENNILNHLYQTFDSANLNGILITGKGGIGKTRMLFELWERLNSEEYVVYYLDPREVDFEHFVNKVLKKQSAKIVLLIDYIEEVEDIESWIRKIEYLPAEIQVRFLAIARNSYLNLFKEKKTKIATIDLSNTGETLYQQKVCSFILKRGIGRIQIDKRIYSSSPAIASFVYLFCRKLMVEDKAKSDFASELQTSTSFLDLVKRIIRRSIGKNIDEELIYLLASLPFSNKDFIEKIERTQEFTALLRDGIIVKYHHERTESSRFRIIHDLLIDEILIDFFNKKNSEFKLTPLRNLVRFSLENEKVQGCVRSLQRVWSKLAIENSSKELYEILDKLIDKRGKKIKKSSSTFALFRIANLIDEESFIRLLSKHPKYFEKYICSKEFSGPLNYILNEVRKGNIFPNHQKDAKKLFNKWYSSNKKKLEEYEFGGFILSNAITLFPEIDFTKNTKRLLKRDGKSIKGSFLISRCIRDYVGKIDIESYLDEWLLNHSISKPAYYIYLSLLQDSTIEMNDKYYDYIIDWIEQNESSPSAIRLLNLILNRKISLAIQYKIYNNLLEDNVNAAYFASSVMSLIEIGFPIEYNFSSIKHWMEIYYDTYHFPEILRKHLELKNSTIGLEKVTDSFLKKNINEYQKCFNYLMLISKYTLSNDMILVVSKFFDLYYQEVSLSYIYQSILKKSPEVSGLIPPFKKWFERYCMIPDSYSTFKFFISKGMPVETDKELLKSVKNWIEKNKEDKNILIFLDKISQQNNNLNIFKFYFSLKGTKSSNQFFRISSRYFNKGGDLKDILTHSLIETDFNNRLIQIYLINSTNYINAEHLILNYLETNINSSKIGLLLQLCVNKKLGAEKIDPIVKKWTKSFPKNFITATLQQNLDYKHNQDVEIEIEEIPTLNNMPRLSKAYLKLKIQLDSILSNFVSNRKSKIQQLLNTNHTNLFIQYLQNHDLTDQFSFLFEPLLQELNDVTLIKDYVKKWCELNKDSRALPRVLGPYIEQGGNPDYLIPSVKLILEKYGSNTRSSFIIQPYLTSGGTPKTIEKYVNTYLTNNYRSTDAIYVISKWLLYGGDCELVLPHILRRGEDDVFHLLDSIIIEPYIIVGDVFDIQDFVLKSLRANLQYKYLNYTFYRLIQSGFQNQEFIDICSDWLDHHGNEGYSGVFIDTLLVQWSEFPQLDIYIQKWLSNNFNREGHNPNLKYVIAKTAKFHTNPGIFFDYIIQWIQRNRQDDEVYYILGNLITKIDHNETLKQEIEHFIKNAPVNRSATFFKRILDKRKNSFKHYIELFDNLIKQNSSEKRNLLPLSQLCKTHPDIFKKYQDDSVSLINQYNESNEAALMITNLLQFSGSPKDFIPLATHFLGQNINNSEIEKKEILKVLFRLSNTKKVRSFIRSLGENTSDLVLKYFCEDIEYEASIDVELVL